MLSKKPAKVIYPKCMTMEKGRIYLTSSIMWLITLRPCHMNALYPTSQIVLWNAENMISTFSEQQSVLTLTSHIWFSSNSIISFILERLLIDSTHKSLTDERFKKRMWKRENILLDQLYKVYQFLFRTADVKEIINHCCKHHTFGPWYSSIRKLDINHCASTILLAHDIQASESSGEKKVAAPEK